VTLANAEGPLFYYVASPGHEPRIVAVDMATGTTLLDRPLERFTGVLLSEGELAIWEGVAPTEIVKLNADGSRGEPIYYSPVGLTDAAYSPDGEKLAIVLYDRGVVVLDRATGETIAALNQYEVPLGEHEGSLWQVKWLADSERLVANLGVPVDSCGPGHIALALDGNFEYIAQVGCEAIAPNGLTMVVPGVGECLAPGTDTIRLVESFTGRENARYSEPRTLLIREAWAPDSSEVLVGRISVPSDVVAEAEPCWLMERPEAYESRDYLLFDAVTFEVSEVEDLDAVYERWYGEWRIQLVCEAATVQVHWAPGQGRRALCPDGFSGGTVTVGGVAVGEARGIEVLGFVER
jgi:hypothetical protein